MAPRALTINGCGAGPADAVPAALMPTGEQTSPKSQLGTALFHDGH
jgi:hypothetical protein